jgi:hypothetical protein
MGFDAAYNRDALQPNGEASSTTSLYVFLIKGVLEEWRDLDFANIPRSPNTSRKPSRMMSFQSTNESLFQSDFKSL